MTEFTTPVPEYGAVPPEAVIVTLVVPPLQVIPPLTAETVKAFDKRGMPD